MIHGDWETTTTILERMRCDGSGPAWDQFLRRFRAPVVRFARGMGLDPADAEDAAQETLIAFSVGLQSGKYDRRGGRLRSWLFGIALRQVSNARRRIAVRGNRLEQSVTTGFWGSVPDPRTAREQWNQVWEHSVVQHCLKCIRQECSPSAVKCFEMVVLHGVSPADAAEQLGTTVRAVYNAKHRVLKRMRELRASFEEA
jgi:RNA polymerase sigma-70 factor (ECF subfamily)